MARAPGKQESPRPVYLPVFLVCIVLCIHATYITTHIPVPPPTIRVTAHHPSSPELAANSTPSLPPLFIYRRTKKSGSSAMLDALIRALQPYDYVPLYLSGPEIKAAVRAESMSPFPRRLLVAEHNQVNRQDDPFRRAIIADTVRNGYDQITSFCRYQRNVSTCDEALVRCLESKEAKAQNRYRWAGREGEDADTYIDLPLSSGHPALSTTIFRRVFPNATLHIYSRNTANSKCPDVPEVREAYNRLYGQLERQVEVLQKRMLTLAGYPCNGNPFESDKISVEEMLDAAEDKEREKYDFDEHDGRNHGFSETHKKLIATIMLWSRAENESLILTRRWK